MLTLHDYGDSGNGYKVRLVLALLDRPWRLVELDIMKGATHAPEFLAKNPDGRIPVLEREDGSCLPESNAILWYLAEGSAWLPSGDGEADRRLRADILRWMCFEQYSHEPYVATPRFILRHLPPDSPRRAELPARQEKGRAALAILDRHLQGTDWLAGGRYTIADVALYAYTHRAEEAGIPLAPHAALRAWLGRVAAHPRHVAMTV